mgnify:CR=1 FL=1
MDRVIETVTSPTTRMWCYNVMATVMTLMTVKGIVNGDEAAAILAVGAALFAVASINTPKSSYQGKHEAE